MSADTLTTFLAVTNRENNAPPLPPPAARVAERPGLSRAERDAQRLCCSRVDSYVPVLVDFAWQRWRSPTAAVLVLLQVACKLVLQAYFPRLGLPAIMVCPSAVQLYAAQHPETMAFSDEGRLGC